MTEPRPDRSGGVYGVSLFAPSRTTRVVTLCGVIAFHVLLLAVLRSTGRIPALLPLILPARLILASSPPPPPPPLVRPTLSAAPAAPVPVPEITLAEQPPDRPASPRAITRAPAVAHPAGHFGAATDGGLGLDVAVARGGGSGTRGSLAGFEAGVRSRVLAGKRQPALAWDRRNTCVVAYRVTVTSGGALAGFSIDPCAVPEINAAAREAIAHAGPFPLPPNLGAATTEVHGTLIFHP